MKKFKFKLEPLLKLREFKEKKIKEELGVIVSKIVKYKKEIEDLKLDIEEAYNSQENVLKSSGTQSANSLKFYPYFIEGKKQHILHREELIEEQNVFYHEKMRELNQARGEVKLIQGMKDKAKNIYKKEMIKEELNNIEEILMMKAKSKVRK